MPNEKFRRRILAEAARLLVTRQESSCGRARIRAARRLCRGWVKPVDMPSDREILDEVQRLGDGDPELAADLRYESQRIIRDLQDAEDAESTGAEAAEIDRFTVYRALLLPLEKVRQNSNTHPEGDALYHSLQVFELARERMPYDEEFLLAALLHDVGKGVDPHDHVRAGLDALGDLITERTAWLIEHHSDAQAIYSRELGARALRRLRQSEDFDALILLAECDRAGRVPGAIVPTVEEALDYLRELEDTWG